jgi:hypothetical protein
LPKHRLAIAADRRTVLRVNGVNLSGVRNASDFQPRVPVAGLFVWGAALERDELEQAKRQPQWEYPATVCLRVAINHAPKTTALLSQTFSSPAL